jgi:hypothetical protein
MRNKRSEIFTDYPWYKYEATQPVTAAGLFPLFLHIADIDAQRPRVGSAKRLGTAPVDRRDRVAELP